jgi:SAM-dependent methyltransferase
LVEGGEEEVASSQPTSVRWRVVRGLFELLYRNSLLYWLASTLPFAGQWRKWQRLVIPRLVGNRVLEIGCGIGTLLLDMALAGYTCSAIERSTQMLAATRARLRRHGLVDSISLRQGLAQELPYADASFESVVSTFPTDYIFDPLTLSQIERVLTPDGRLIVVLGASLVPNHMLLLPLIALQSLVYGRAGKNAGPLKNRDREPEDGGPVREITAAIGPRGEALLQGLRTVGLLGSIEVQQGPFWEAFLCIARKTL